MKCRFVVYENAQHAAFWRAVACEMFATAIYVFIGCGSVILQQNESAPVSSATSIRIALAFGFATNMLIKTFGPVSGCHINPAVSIAFMIIGKVSVVRAILYVMVQTIGATLGAGGLYTLLPPKFRTNLGVTRLLNNVTPTQGVAIEAVSTFILVLALSACLDEKRIDQFKLRITNPLTIGLTVSALHFVGIPFTGASMNPARSFGPAVIMLRWNHHWIYWAGPVGGACLSAAVYHFFISTRHHSLVVRTKKGPNGSIIHYTSYEKDTSTSTDSQIVDVPLETFNCSTAVNVGYDPAIGGPKRNASFQQGGYDSSGSLIAPKRSTSFNTKIPIDTTRV